MLAENAYQDNSEISFDYTDTDSLKQYLREISKFELLSDEEVASLFKRIENGDRVAYDIVVEHNLRLVVKYARSIKKSYRAQESVMDLVQAGNIGLMRAVDKFEVDKGYAFSTYASWWIKQSIIRHIYDNESAIRVPVHMSEKFVGISRAIRNFQEETGREPSFEEIAQKSNVTRKEYNLFKSIDRNVLSLNATAGDDDSEFGDFIRDGDSSDPVYEEANKTLLSETVQEVLGKLDSREAYIIKARYGIGDSYVKTLEEIGSDLGITRERVRQIESIAMKKLRTSIKAESLRAYK
ncbi:MAG: sigma-70 family RNA polymerase sigma factor [Ruminococcaceae bacterium]|nr:sigma-70 family RNA polymerase sigma factor [Oscillospiraceae bacterium]